MLTRWAWLTGCRWGMAIATMAGEPEDEAAGGNHLRTPDLDHQDGRRGGRARLPVLEAERG